MTCEIREVPFGESVLSRLAADLLAACPAGDGGELPDAVVLLPSRRACQTLAHLLLDIAGAPALLLPGIHTLEEWTEELVFGAGLGIPDVPDDRVRPLALGPRLAGLLWLAARPESAPGLAAEFVRFFDLVRLNGRQDLVLDGGAQDADLAQGPWADIVAKDLHLIREVWAIYRQAVPRDRVDQIADLARLFAQDPGTVWGRTPRPPLVVAAGFGQLDRVPARILCAALERGLTSRLYLPAAADALDKVFLSTWSAEGSEATDFASTDPLAPTRRLLRLLGEAGCRAAAESAARDAAAAPVGDLPLRDRLERAGGIQALLAPAGPFTLVRCPDPETESRLVTDTVVAALNYPGDQAAHPLPTLAVAVADTRLAQRIVAQLKDAGIDVDQTHGRPLSTLPAGLLLRFILRSVLTDLRAEPLLEVLTHPYVDLQPQEGTHGLWTLRLERMFRREEGPPGGLAGICRRAADRDQVIQELFLRQGRPMVAFVTAIAEAFAPLLALQRDGKAHPWPTHLEAVRRTWAALTHGTAADPKGRADGEAGDKDRADVTALFNLLDVLDLDGAQLPAATLGEFAGDLGRLMVEEQVRAHRPRYLPVVVMGLIEARLERFDRLILAGLRDGAVPSRPQATPFLPPGLLARLGLPGWREHLGLEAELFLRLLHNGQAVTLTWAEEQDGQEQLPSPFVSRLQLVLGLQPGQVEGPPPDLPVWRREELPWAAIQDRQEAFAAEPRPCPALAPIRPQTSLSWSALRLWRDCPYRFLLERGFGLRKEEDIRKEFGRLDYGSLVHQALRNFLDPAGAGAVAVAAGKRTEARRLLEEAATAVFSQDADDLPVRRLWLDGFRRAVPQVVTAEIARAARWRPLLLEGRFSLPLPGLARWARRQGAGQDRPGFWEDVLARGGQVILQGTIDRVDGDLQDPSRVAVLDYKTGKMPTARKVQELEDMQVVLYAAALEAGGVPGLAGQVRVAEGSYYQVTPAQAGPPVRPHLDGCSAEGRGLLLDGAVRLIELALQAADPHAEYPLLPREAAGAGDPQLPCRHCDLRGICRLEDLERDQLLPAAWRKLDHLVNLREGGY